MCRCSDDLFVGVVVGEGVGMGVVSHHSSGVGVVVGDGVVGGRGTASHHQSSDCRTQQSSM